MSRKTGEGLEAVYAAAKHFVDSCLARDGSMFAPDRTIWTGPTSQDLHRRLVEHPDTGSDPFERKLERQLAGAPADTVQLAAELLYVHFLITRQLKGETKRRQIETVVSWSSRPSHIPPHLEAALHAGICNAGQAFMQQRPFLLWYLNDFIQKWKATPSETQTRLLADPWAFKGFVFGIKGPKSSLQQHALLHLVYPDTFESIVSEHHKSRIAASFQTAAEASEEPDIDRRLLRIRQRLSSQYGSTFTYYDDKIREAWDDTGTQSNNDVLKDDDSPTTGVWIEKTLHKGHPHRQGEHGLGRAIWSPKRSRDGRDTYRAMHNVRPGDVVLHLTDNQRFVGASLVDSGPQDFKGLEGTPWEGQDCIRYDLRDYVELTPPLEREELFSEHNSARLLAILASHRGLFFNRTLTLNQGAYLTAAPGVLVELLNEIYRGISGGPLPHIPSSAMTPPPPPQPTARALTLDWLAAQTLWTKERLSEALDVLNSHAPHLVLSGPPGTGKTWVAQLLARYVVGDDPSRHRLVQFHPSYSYESFVEGLRPVAHDGAITFERANGVLLDFQAAMEEQDRPFVLIIDEMNRANLPRVFGELMFLLEYRDREIDLQYSRGFRLSPQLKIIATMNTADRSTRSIDLALRRRFSFLECPPDMAALERFLTGNDVQSTGIVDGLQRLNGELSQRLGRHFTIGHSYFMVPSLNADRLLSIWTRKLLPLLEDYFFDQPDNLADLDPGLFWPELRD